MIVLLVHPLDLPNLTQNIRFPNLLPIEMSHWTQYLLKKHGSLVRSMALQLSVEWFEEQAVVHGQDVYDNTIVPPINLAREKLATRPPQSLGPQTVSAVLSLCPKVHSLSLTCPHRPDVQHVSRHSINLQAQLVKLISSFARLQHLEIECRKSCRVHEDTICHVIKNLPLLESLYCSSIVRGTATEAGPVFVKHLAELPRLTRLQLVNVACVDDNLRSCSGLMNLVELEIIFCINLTITQAPKAISTFAPNLTRLELRLVETEGKPSTFWENQDSFDPMIHCFDLPALTTLRISNDSKYELFGSFKNSHRLRWLNYTGLRPPQWPVFAQLVYASTWPVLRYMKLECPIRFYGEALGAGIYACEEELIQYCRRARIQLRLS